MGAPCTQEVMQKGYQLWAAKDLPGLPWPPKVITASSPATVAKEKKNKHAVNTTPCCTHYSIQQEAGTSSSLATVIVGTVRISSKGIAAASTRLLWAIHIQHTGINANRHMCTHAHTYTSMCMHTCTNSHTSKHAHTHKHTHTHTHTQMHTLKPPTPLFTHTHSYTHMHTHIHIETHIETHTLLTAFFGADMGQAP